MPGTHSQPFTSDASLICPSSSKWWKYYGLQTGFSSFFAIPLNFNPFIPSRGWMSNLGWGPISVLISYHLLCNFYTGGLAPALCNVGVLSNHCLLSPILDWGRNSPILTSCCRKGAFQSPGDWPLADILGFPKQSTLSNYWLQKTCQRFSLSTININVKCDSYFCDAFSDENSLVSAVFVPPTSAKADCQWVSGSSSALLDDSMFSLL